jgi:hypothetical protein
MHLLPVALCLISISAFAEPINLQQAESKPTLTSAQDSQSATGTPPKTKKKREFVILPAISGYSDFIRDLYLDHEDYLKHLRENPDDRKSPPEGTFLAAVIGISRQNFLTVQTYALQTYQRTEANDTEMHKKVDEIHLQRVATEADLNVFRQRHEELMQNLISDLQKELDRDSFQRLDDYVLRKYRRSILEPLPQGHRHQK